MQWYWKWNRIIPPVLWGLVILGLLASLPLAYNRIRTENSAKKVEFTFDYRDLLEISDYRPQPQEYVNRHLDALKKAGVRSLAVYETTLGELQLSRRVELYNAHDAAMMTQKSVSSMENNTYLLFADDNTRQKLQGVIERGFQRFGVKTRPWTLGSRSGLAVELAFDEAVLKPLGPDPMTLESLKAKQFSIVARLSNRHQPFVEADMDQMLDSWKSAGVANVIVEGDAVPGYNPNSKPADIITFAKLMNKYRMELVSVELIKPPSGINTLAKHLNYRVMRGHSFTEADADKLIANMTKKDLNNRILGVADRFVLAVKDRNIKLILLNARAVKNPDKGAMLDPVAPILESLKGPDGAVSRIQKAGYTVATGAHSFIDYNSGLSGFFRGLVIIGSIALMALTLSYFIPSFTLGFFILGIIGTLSLYVLSQNLLFKTLALGAASCAPTLAMILAVQKIRSKAGTQSDSRIGFVVNLFIRAVLTSLIGALFVIGLLSDISYNLMLDQFTGVKALGALPVLLVAVYILLFSEGLGGMERRRKAKRLLTSYISVLWVVTAAVLGGALLYYISRTGNEGQVSSFELLFRSFLENTLGVRPRTKEFLIGHPLFFLGAFLCIKYRLNYVYLFLFGVIGLTDIVGTFTHLHTPILISAIRVSYGLLFGAVIGFILIGVWELFTRGWRKWAEPFTE